MLLKPLTIAAAGLAVAKAFLLPPDVAIESTGIHSLEAPKIAESQHVEIDCPGCPLQLKSHHGKFRVKQGIKNHLEFDFKVDHQPEYDRLLVNGFELYPNADPITQILAAPQVAKFDDKHKGHRKSFKHHDAFAPQLGFMLQSGRGIRDEESMMDLITIDLQITQVAHSFVDGIPNMHIQLIKSAEGALMIGAVRVTESQTLQSNPMEKQEECTTILCKWRAIVAERVKQLGRHKCGKIGKMGHPNGHPRPHRHHGGRPHRFQPHEHKWSQLFEKFGSHILFPVLIGIVAGVTASIIGMMVGTLIIGLWRVIVRRQSFFHHRRRHCHHRSSRKEVAAVEEKAALMEEHQDPPPTYKDDNNDN